MRAVRAAYAALVYLFLYTPLVLVGAFSFNASKYSLSWKGFTWKWYAHLAGNQALIDSALRSAAIAVAAATLSALLGLVFAFVLRHYRFRGRRAIFGGLFVMMMSPDIVIAISLLILFLAAGLSLGFATLLTAHVVLCVPFTTAAIYTRLRGIDPNVVDAARDLGAGELQVLRHVVAPLALPAVAAGWLLAFTLSLDDVIISFFTTGPDYEVLPLRIYSMVRLGIKPEVNALCVVMILATVTAVFLSRRLLRK